jgi:hypothetical protein
MQTTSKQRNTETKGKLAQKFNFAVVYNLGLHRLHQRKDTIYIKMSAPF